MKKLISLCLMLLVCLSLSACSKSDTGIPDDLVVVLPDGQEIYLYMPHDDAAEILGVADSVDDSMGKTYEYSALHLTVRYKNSLLASITIDANSQCRLKSGISPASKKSDFSKAGFSTDTAPYKFYIIEDDKTYKISPTQPKSDVPFQSAVTVGSYDILTDDAFDLGGHQISIADLHCAQWLSFDK